MKKIRLGDIATLITKGTTPTTIGFSFVDTGINFVKIESIGDNGEFLPDKFAHITDECDKKLKRSQLEENDILFSIAGAIGRTAIVPRNILPANTNQALAIIRIPQNAINLRFVLYALQSQSVEEQSEKQKQGVAQLNLSLKNIADILIPLVSSERQDEIVRNLDAVDAAIALRKKQICLVDQLVKSRFIELFESKSWDTIQAGSIMFNMRNGVSPSNTGSFPAKVLTLSAITQGSFDPAAWKDGTFDSDPPIEKRVSASDFYMCRGNGNKNLVGAGVYSKEDRHDLVFPDTAIAASIDLQKVCLPYLFHAWKRPAVREQIERGARTTNGTYKINQRVVSNIELILPPMELQEQFAAFVEQVDKSKLAVQKGLQELEILKKSLMQQYFG